MYEKSCGAVIFHPSPDGLTVLLIRQKKGHWAFPKGHREGNETELATAEREIYEETGLRPVIDTGFRYVNTYQPKPVGSKDVVLFAAVSAETAVTLQQAELLDSAWLSPEDAMQRLTYERDQNAFAAALSYYTQKQA